MVFSMCAPGTQASSANRFANDVTIVQKPGLLEAEVDGEIVALHIESGKCYAMNEVSSCIWSMLTTTQTVGSVHLALMARYAVDEGECREQVALLLAQLELEGLIAVEAD